MAEISQVITTMPEAPQTTDGEVVFTAKADPFLASMEGMPPEYNAFGSQANSLRTDVLAAQTAAETAETNAETARDKAEEWAENPEDDPVETGKYSALHWSAKSNTSATAAAASAAAAAASEAAFEDFDDRYLGAHATAPTHDDEGGALTLGMMYFDTTLNLMKVYSDTGWVNTGSAVNGTSNRYCYIVGTPAGDYTGSTTLFPAIYDAGYIDVYRNGVKLIPADFTADNGTSMTLSSAAETSDSINIITFGTFEVTNAVLTTTPDVNAVAWVVDEDDMASDSSARVPTQQSTKAYVDNTALSLSQIQAISLSF